MSSVNRFQDYAMQHHHQQPYHPTAYQNHQPYQHNQYAQNPYGAPYARQIHVQEQFAAPDRPVWSAAQPHAAVPYHAPHGEAWRPQPRIPFNPTRGASPGPQYHPANPLQQSQNGVQSSSPFSSPYRKASPALNALQQSHTRASPSMSRRLGPPPIASSSSRCPTSRGVSPVGSQFSTATEAAQLNHLGLPITKPRNYKVKLPVEFRAPSDESEKPSKVKRTPLDSKIHDLHETANCLVRSKDPHPEEHLYREPLPDCVDIYLPNDWQALKDALFEERLARLGIIREYLKHIETVLPAKTDSETSTPSPLTGGLSSRFPVPPGSHQHQRAGSLFIPQNNRLFSPLFRANAAPFKPGHQSHMSIAGSSDPRKPLLQDYMQRQMLQLGERAKSLLPLKGLSQSNAIQEEAEDEPESELAHPPALVDEGEPAVERRPARSMSLAELNAGFGLDIESELEERVMPRATVVAEEAEEATAMRTSDNAESTGIPEPAATDNGQPIAASSSAGHEARRSLSTPNLQTLARELAGELPYRDSPASEHGYVAGDSHSDDDRLSSGSGDYSNPSDELAARQRRDRSTSKANSHTMSPIAVLRSPENWMERNESEDIISNPSDEELLARRPSWAQLSSAQQGIPFLLHASTGSTSSSVQPGRKATLNAAAPEFVIGAAFNLAGSNLGSFSSSATSTQHAKPSLNAFAAEFRPSFGSGSRLPQPQNSTPQVTLVSPRLVLPEADGDPFGASPKAKGSVEIWLSDTSEAHTPAPLEIVSRVQETLPVDNIRSFKFPPSPVLQPVSLPSQVSPLTQRAPQLPPLGTIGRNTLLDKTLQDFTIVSPRYGDTPAFPSDAPDSSHRYRKPIPKFEPDASSQDIGANAEARNSVMVAQASGLASDVSISEFGGRGNSSAMKPRAPRPLPVPPLDKEDPSASNDTVETSGVVSSRTSVSEAADDENDSDAASSSNEFVYAQADSDLSKTWRLFESILDRKLDVLRMDLFNNSTPLPPPPITAEAQDALTVAIIEAIKHEMPVQGSGSSTGNGDINTSLLVAIHETQEMLQDLQSRGSDSIKEIIDTLQTKSSPTTPPQSMHETLQIVVENAIAKHSDSYRMPPLDVPAITAALAEAVKPQLYTLMDLATDKRETAALIVAQLEPKLSALKLDNNVDDFLKIVTETSADQISRKMSEAVQTGLEAILPKLVPLPSSPTVPTRDAAYIDDSVAQLQDSITVSQMQLIQRLDDMSSAQQDYRGIMEQKVELEGLLAQSRAEYARERSEKASQQSYFQSERQRYDRELSDLRQTVSAREQQVDLLRQELLNRATSMDDEQVQREERHVTQLNDYRTLCGGMEAELAILKTQLKEAKAEKANLVDAIEKGQDRLHDQERDHHATSVEVRERLAGALAELAIKSERLARLADQLATAKREAQESQSSNNLLQGRLTELRAEKASLETRLASAYHDLAAAKQKEVAANTKLDDTRNELSILQSELREKEDDHRQAFERLQEENVTLRLIASQAQQTSLGLLLSRKDEMPGSNTALVYESCVVVQDQVFFSSTGFEQDLNKHQGESSESSIESIPLASDVSSDTLQMSQDESMLSKDIGDQSYVSTRTMPTPDDSGWYS